MTDLEIQENFLKNNYVVVNQIIPEFLANMMYRMSLKKCDRLSLKLSTPYYKYYDSKFDGSIGEEDGDFKNKMSNCFNFYGDEFCDTLLEELLPFMETYTKKKLVCTYTYLRLYQQGNSLPIHSDRHECEFSTTLCLGYDISNLNDNKDYCWPIFLKLENNDIEIKLRPGDMLIYKGCILPHWRPEFLGNNHSQLFLHYNDENNNPNKFDGRKNLGLPKIY